MAAPIITDGSFEACGANPGSCVWTFEDTNAGQIASNANPPESYDIPTPDGSYYAYFTDFNYISQPITLPTTSGSYVLSFDYAAVSSGEGADNCQLYAVLGSQNLGETNFVSLSSGFQSQSFDFSYTPGSTATLYIVLNCNHGGIIDMEIDAVSIDAV